MSNKHNKTGRTKRSLSPFIALERYIKASPAWSTMSTVSKCAHLEIIAAYDGSNNGKLVMSALMLSQRLHVSKATAGRALEDLIGRGLIVCTHKGGFSQKWGLRRASEWRLTHLVDHVTGSVPSKEFMRWKNTARESAVSPQTPGGLTGEQQSGGNP